MCRIREKEIQTFYLKFCRILNEKEEDDRLMFCGKEEETNVIFEAKKNKSREVLLLDFINKT